MVELVVQKFGLADRHFFGDHVTVSDEGVAYLYKKDPSTASKLVVVVNPTSYDFILVEHSEKV